MSRVSFKSTDDDVLSSCDSFGSPINEMIIK